MGLLVASLIGLHGEHVEEGKKVDSLVNKSSHLIHGQPDVLKAGPQVQCLLQDDVSSRCGNWTSPGICLWLARKAGLQAHLLLQDTVGSSVGRCPKSRHELVSAAA